VSAETRARLLGYEHAFDHPVTFWVIIALAAILLLVPALVWFLAASARISDSLRSELFQRYYSWLVIVALLLGPILLGALWTILGITLLSLLCYREFARATGFFRERFMSLQVVLGIVLMNAAALDNWLGLFMALQPLTIVGLAALTITDDRPQGYIQRVALAVFAYTLFGAALSHLSFFANDVNYRPILILIFLSVELNDVFAFLAGKTLGRRRLAPNTSPKKTVAGALGAVVLTTLLVVGLGWQVFRETELAQPLPLAVLGILISSVGQLGDLMLSSIKRDLGIKDMGVLIPGHGGLLDRFDSILLVAPAVFHYVHYFVGVANGQPARIFTGG